MFKENILKLFEKVNKESLNASIGFYLFPPDSGFVTEEAIDTISGQKEIDSETKIIFWLWRIQRYFMVNEETKGIDRKSVV